MSSIKIQGGKPLIGSVAISGAKNASLPILTACLLIKGVTQLYNVPDIGDIRTMLRILQCIGVKITKGEQEGSLLIDATKVNGDADLSEAEKIRGSQTLLSTMLNRCGEVRLPPLGGCNIGTRQMDLHINSLQRLGADFTMEQGWIHMKTTGLKGSTIYLDYSSVGATENAILASCLAEGNTIIENAAQEPEIVDLINFLNKAGAKIFGLGSKTIRVVGVKTLKSNHYHRIMPDRIEAGSFMIAAVMTHGDLVITNMSVADNSSLVYKLKEIGATVDVIGQDSVHVRMKKRPHSFQIKTMPYPGFPTDLQSPMMALACIADGVSVIVENVFENRFQVARELSKMGAKIVTSKKVATVFGTSGLTPATVVSPDLRGGMSLVLAALSIPEFSVIEAFEKVNRGYDRFQQKLTSLGVKIINQEDFA